tara:strand:+ start:50999 stop:51913 length:915 start_codon:yes stop_codon:yes gene_type:complete
VIEKSENVDYEMPKIGMSKWIVLLTGTFVFAVFLYFPISDKIDGLVKKSLAANPSCSLSYEDVSFELFLPKFVITNLNIPAGCMGSRGGNDIFLKTVNLNIRGISFTPFGPHFLIETELYNNPIEAYLTVGFGTIAINLQEAKVKLKELSSIIPMVKLQGTLTIDALVELSTKGIQDLKAHIYSKDLVFPKQKLPNPPLTLPTFNIQDLLIKATMEGNKVMVQELILGTPESPIRANFKGPINLNQSNISYSQLNLKGELAFSDKFIKDFMVIDMYMKQFTKKDNFYQIEISGPLMRPSLRSQR